MRPTFTTAMSASAPTNSDNHPQRTEPVRLLRPTTLTHCIIPDAGAGGERIDSYNGNLKLSTRVTPTPSASELSRTFTQSSSQTQILPQENLLPGGYSAVLLMYSALRIAFYLGVITLALGLTLAACKFTNFWDPCEHLYINTTECKVTSYLKGMVYHTDCTEEHYCILPGFQSNIHRQAWSLHQPNETTAEVNRTPSVDQFLV